MKRAELGQVVRYNDALHEVVGIGDGRSVVLRAIGAVPCPSCGRLGDAVLLEDSRNFQTQVHPVKTIGGDE